MSVAEDFVKEHGHRLRLAARSGYAARGLVFLIIGYFAFRAAFATGQAMGTDDAVSVIAGSSSGSLVLSILIVALFSFAIWRVLQVVFDIDGHGTDAKGLFVRLGLAISAFTYGTLGYYALSLLVGLAGGSGGGGVVSAAYEAGYGVWLTYVVAAGMAAAGVAHLVKAAKAGFRKYMSFPASTEPWLPIVCRFGLVARGITFFILAGLLVTGAVSYSGGETPGLGAALSRMSQWSFGWLLLAITGLGLVAFGIYGLAEAIYRRIDIQAVT